MKRVPIKVEEHSRERYPLKFWWNEIEYEVEQAYLTSLLESKTGIYAFKCMCRVNGRWHTLWMDGENWFVEIEEY